MAEKVKVSKEVGKALDYWFFNYQDDAGEDLILNHGVSISDGIGWIGQYKPLGQLSMIDVANIIVKGYEVEELVEDRIMKDYEVACRNIERQPHDPYWVGYRNAIINMLFLQEIEIEGINYLVENK